MNDELIKGDQQQNTEYDTRDPEVPVVLHHIPPSANKQHTDGKEKRAKHYVGTALKWVWTGIVSFWRNVFWNKSFWTFAATVVMAVATAIYAIYAARQWRAINDQLPELRKSAEAAKTAAKAASRNARTADESFKTAARPYIVIDNIQKADKKTGARIFCSTKLEEICVRIYYTVTGQTPAISVQREAHVLFEKNWEVAKNAINNWTPKCLESPDGFPPMSTTHHIWDEPIAETLSPNEASLLLKDRGIVYVYGAIKYRDLLKHRHVTRFCFVQSVIPHCPKEGCFDNCEFGNYIDQPEDVR